MIVISGCSHRYHSFNTMHGPGIAGDPRQRANTRLMYPVTLRSSARVCLFSSLKRDRARIAWWSEDILMMLWLQVEY